MYEDNGNCPGIPAEVNEMTETQKQGQVDGGQYTWEMWLSFRGSRWEIFSFQAKWTRISKLNERIHTKLESRVVI